MENCGQDSNFTAISILTFQNAFKGNLVTLPTYSMKKMLHFRSPVTFNYDIKAICTPSLLRAESGDCESKIMMGGKVIYSTYMCET
jgi:hypothetical protein